MIPLRDSDPDFELKNDALSACDLALKRKAVDGGTVTALKTLKFRSSSVLFSFYVGTARVSSSRPIHLPQ